MCIYVLPQALRQEIHRNSMHGCRWEKSPLWLILYGSLLFHSSQALSARERTLPERIFGNGLQSFLQHKQV